LLKRAYTVKKKQNFSDFKNCLSFLNNPHKKYKTVHIAGTNGKGSCVLMLGEIFKTAGYKTGVYTSPHLICPTERIQINGKNISKREFAAAVNKVMLAERQKSGKNRVKNHLTFFEILTAAAFNHFADKKVDIAIIETGIGGRKDITKLISPKICAITSVGWDHMHILGDSIEKIAREKAGIVKKNVPCILGKIDKKAERVIRKIARQKNAPIKKYLPKKFVLNNSNPIQQINAAVCYQIAKYFDIKDKQIFSALKKVKFPARFQIIKKNGKTYIIDGAHNKQAIENFFKTFRSQTAYDIDKSMFITSMMMDKNCKEIARFIGRNTKNIIFTRTDKIRGENPEKLAEWSGSKNALICENLEKALKKSAKFDTKIFIGSFYLAGQILKKIMKK